MSTTPKTFTYITDPGHGWLIVSPDDLHKAELPDYKITRYSYINGARSQIALEEDCDMATFLDAWHLKFGMPELRHQEQNPCNIRSWASFGTKGMLKATELDAIANEATEQAAATLEVSPEAICSVLRVTQWQSPAVMLNMLFTGHRGDPPVCDLDLPAERVLAEMFDALAKLVDDNRRAIRKQGALT